MVYRSSKWWFSTAMLNNQRVIYKDIWSLKRLIFEVWLSTWQNMRELTAKNWEKGKQQIMNPSCLGSLCPVDPWESIVMAKTSGLLYYWTLTSLLRFLHPISFRHLSFCVCNCVTVTFVQIRAWQTHVPRLAESGGTSWVRWQSASE
jgi:hypothetical protein